MDDDTQTVQNRSQFMRDLFETRSGMSSPTRKKQPLDLESNHSSLKKIQRAGISVENYAGGAVSDYENSGLAQFLKNEYGEFMPKQHIMSLPEYKIVEFIRIISEYHKKMKSQFKFWTQLFQRSQKGKLLILSLTLIIPI